MESTLATLEEYEKDPSFSSLKPEEKELFYSNYFAEKQKSAKTEDEYNSYLSEDSERTRLGIANKYKALFPEDTQFDESKLTEYPDLQKEVDRYKSLTSEFSYNQDEKNVRSFKADDMDDPNRSLSYKPFKFNGSTGYSVKYPNGDIETVNGIDSESQLTEFFKTQRRDKFNGKREGMIDKLVGDDEFTKIEEKIRNVESGVAGNVNAFRKGFSGILQGFMTDDVVRMSDTNKGMDKNQEELKALMLKDAEIYKNNPDTPEGIAAKERFNLNSKASANSSPANKGTRYKPEVITAKYSALFDEMKAAEKISGTTSLDSFQRYMMDKPEGERGDAGTFFGYFKSNPGEILPYIAATISSSLPDIGAAVAAGVGGTVAGGPIGGFAAGGGYGALREYSATLLSEVQLEAQRRNTQLTPELFQSLVADDKFMEAAKSKAKTRAGIIGATDAILGGSLDLIVKTFKGGLNRAVIGSTLGAASEFTGEALAGKVTEGEVNITESMNEAIGGLGLAPATVALGALSDRRATLNERVAKVASDLNQAADGKKTNFRPAAADRINAMAEEISAPIPQEETPEESQSREAYVKQKTKDDPSYSPTTDTAIPSTLNNRYEEVAQEAKDSISEEPEDTVDKPIVEEEIADEKQLTEKAPGMLAKAFDFFAAATGTPTVSAAIKYNQSLDRANEILSSRYIREAVKQLADSKSFDRIMTEVRNSGYDSAAQGRLMSAIGLSPEDKNREVITNVLGNYWALASQQPDKASKAEMKGILLSQALDTIYREDFNVSSLYEMPLSKLKKTNKDTIVLNMIPEGIVSDGVSADYQSGATAYDIEGDESIKRFNKAIKKGTVVFNPERQDYDNKYNESVRLNRPNIDVVDVDAIADNNLDRAKQLFDRFKKTGTEFVMKPKYGYAGAGVVSSLDYNTPQKLAKLLTDNNYEYYAETAVTPADGENRFKEYRVHVMVDGAGKAHAFRNLTFDKSRSYFSQTARAAKDKEDVFFLVPDSPNNREIKALQEHAEKTLSGKGFKNIILGLDVAMVEQDGKTAPFVFETNPLTEKGMSGWLGYSASMHEILSELTGRPSMMAGLYEASKLSLTQEQLTEVTRRVEEGMPPDYMALPKAYEALSKGIATFNNYIDESAWLQGMQNLFIDLPVDFFNKLLDSIKSVFRTTVDAIFFNKQTGESADLNLNPEQEVLKNTEYSSLSESVSDVINKTLNDNDRDFIEKALGNLEESYTPEQFFQAALSNPVIRKKLSGIPSVNGNSKTLYSEAVEFIREKIGIPFNKSGLVHAAIEGNSKGSFYTEVSGTAIDGTEYSGKDAYATTPESVAGVTAKRDEVPESIKNQSEVTEVSRKDKAKKVKEAVAQSRFNKLKKMFPELLKGIAYDGTNISEVREKVIDYLNQNINDVDAKGKAATKKKKEEAARLVENKILALSAAREFANDPRLTEGHVSVMLDSLEYVMRKTSDMSNMTTRKLQYYNNVLESMSDGGPPVGFKHLALEAQVEKFEKINADRVANNQIPLFGAPMANWRRRLLLGIFGNTGSIVNQASEIAYLAQNEAAHKYINDIMGIYKTNIDLQQLENEELKNEYYAFQKATLGNINPLQSHRIGLVARLTQYKKDPTKGTPISQIIQRYKELQHGYKLMEDNDKTKKGLTQNAEESILNGTDLTTFTDHVTAIQFLESQLTDNERKVLYKAREIGQRLLPALRTVKAITKSAKLDEWENYVHDSSITPGTESQPVAPDKAFTSMADVLHDRKGISLKEPPKAYAEVNIESMMDNQIQSATYEKHTGMERYILSGILADDSPIVTILDKDSRPTNPISKRMKELLGSYHNSMTSGQERTYAIVALLESLMNNVLGTLIVSVKAFSTNFISSAVSRASLFALGEDAYKDAFVYDTFSEEIKGFIERHVPTQFNRTNSLDLQPDREKFSYWNRALADIQARQGKTKLGVAKDVAAIFAKTLGRIPKSLSDTYSDKILSRLSNLSNGLPERRNAFAIWTAAYIHFAKQNGTIKDSADFVINQVYDKRAAFDANQWVNRSLGYAPNKADKGSFWNGDSRTKVVLGRALFVFRQQSSGIFSELNNQTAQLARATRRGDVKEMKKAFIMMTVLLSNTLTFRLLSTIISSSMMWTGLAAYISSDDDEEVRKAMQDQEEKYRLRTGLGNTQGLITELATGALLPVTSGSAILEPALSAVFDYTKTIFDYDNKNNEKIIADVIVRKKDDIKKEIDELDARIKTLEKGLGTAKEFSVDSQKIEEEIDKLTNAKSMLTERMKFSYFPNRPDKAALLFLGGYGIGLENASSKIGDWLGTDLDDEKKAKIKAIADKEFAMVDPIAGPGWALGIPNKITDLAQVISGTFGKKSDSPDSLYWMKALGAGMNPEVIVERTRLELAKKYLQKQADNERHLEEIKKRYGY